MPAGRGNASPGAGEPARAGPLHQGAGYRVDRSGAPLAGAPDDVVPAKRKPMKNASAAKKTPAKKAMDRKLVSTMEDYEVKYLAQKHSVTQKAVKAAVAKVGHSRSKVEAELKKGK